MHSANFTPCSRLEALLRPPPVLLALSVPLLLPVLLPVPLVWAGALEPHAQIRATVGDQGQCGQRP